MRRVFLKSLGVICLKVISVFLRFWFRHSIIPLSINNLKKFVYNRIVISTLSLNDFLFVKMPKSKNFWR